jgi:hypothetical protein
LSGNDSASPDACSQAIDLDLDLQEERKKKEEKQTDKHVNSCSFTLLKSILEALSNIAGTWFKLNEITAQNTGS